MLHNHHERATVLVVDDDTVNVMVLKKGLSLYYHVLVANGGKEALTIAEREEPDLILLDIDMPGMSGFDVCRQLKSKHETENIPVVFITGRGQVEDEVRGLESGAVDYITRPFEWAIVRSRIKTHIELKRKTDILERFVNIDGLTSIANRRRFDDFLSHEWNRAARNGKELSLIMMDVDYFKEYNDHYGHVAGDDCLIAIAHCLQRIMKRSVDLAARYGGEEFVAVLPDTSLEGALSVANGIRESVESLGIPHAYSNAATRLTISLGVATMKVDMQHSAINLITAADHCLYQAKKNGRNCVEYRPCQSIATL
jgi:diguanylate cyclase (GGDEF)-like protein